MSKDLKKSAEKMERKADRQVEEIRRAVRLYNESANDQPINNPARRIDIERELERAVGDYLRIHKSLRRLRKKMQV